MPGNPPGLADKPDKGERGPVLGATGQRGAADKVAGLVQLHEATKARFERRDLAAELVAVQRHPGLEAERVACRQSRWHEPFAEADRGQRLPYARGIGGICEDLE